ncbi:MAG: hypothetical protein K9K78_02280, partial [Spirochaetales bacterium]|nr:hypothetical protein [Spirochaetales bacterium]
MVIPAIQSFLNPMYLIAAALGAAFMLPLIEKAGKSAARITVLIIAGIFAVVPLLWMMYWIAELGFAAAFAAAPLVVETIGFSAPYSISFRVGMQEAVILTMVNSIALFGGGFSFLRKNPYWSGKKLVLFLTLLIGVNGLILTRDLFNVFVFLEITSISTYALIASNGKRNAFEAGFKYIIAGSIASAFFIIGVIYLYRFTGTLSLDQMISMKRAGVPGVFGEVGAEQSGVLGFVGIGGAAAALFLIMTALLIELKPFPANGWAMDVYEAADPSISALISALAASGVLTVFYHISHLLPQSMLQLALISGGLTFLFSQFIGLRQTKVRRMLGYSSSAQIGLLILIIGLRLPVETYGKSLSAHFPGLHIPFDFGPSISLMLIFLVLLGSHIFSKAGLFWITDLLRSVETVNSMDEIRTLRGPKVSKRLLTVLLGVLTGALIGLPPFPAFWAKWFLLSFLAQAQQWTIMVIILAGSLMEAAYLFRWFITQVRNEADPGTV